MAPERRAVLLLVALAVGGQALRAWIRRPDLAPGEALLPLPGRAPGSPLAHRDSGLALARPLRPGERIDLDRAAPLEIARLPRIGLTLAKTIVADRAARGPFGSLQGLDRVPGVGPGLLAAIAPLVAFSGVPRTGPAGTGAGDTEAAATGPLDLNTATVAQLERLPYIGPALAGRIAAFRDRHGPFASVDSLLRVPGIGPATLARLRGRVRVE